MPLFKQGLWYVGGKAFPDQEQAVAYERSNPQLPAVFGQLNNAPKVMAGTPAPAPQFQPKPMMPSPAQAPAPQQGAERSSGILDLLTQGKSKPSMNQSDVLMAIGSGMLGLSADPNLQRLGVAGFGQVADRSKVRQQSARNNMTVDAMVKSGYISEKQADVLRSNPDLIKGVFEQAVKGRSPSSTIGKLQSDLNSGLITPEQYQQEVARLAKSGQTVVNIGGEPSGDDFFKNLQKGSADAIVTAAQTLPQVQESIAQIETLQRLGSIMDSSTTIPPALRKFVPEGISSPVDAYQSLAYGLAQSLRVAGTGAQSDKDFEVLLQRAGSVSATPEARALIHKGLVNAAKLKRDYALAAQELMLNPSAEGKQAYAKRMEELSQRRLYSEDEFAVMESMSKPDMSNIEIPEVAPAQARPEVKSIWPELSDEQKRKFMEIYR